MIATGALGSGGEGLSAEGYAIKLSAAVVSKHAPSVWSWLMTRLGGADLLVLGPGGAGKSSFINYLLDGELSPAAHEHFATTSIATHKQVTLAIGADKRLIFRVKRTTEIPGQSSPADHANMLVKNKADAILLLVDASQPSDTTVSWVTEFSERIAEMVGSRELDSASLQKIMIAINKHDRLADKNDFLTLRDDLRSAMAGALTGAASVEQVARIPILPCVSIRTALGEAYINDVITSLARRMKGR